MEGLFAGGKSPYKDVATATAIKEWMKKMVAKTNAEAKEQVRKKEALLDLMTQ